jgi:enterochelin esterase-like enzyme
MSSKPHLSQYPQYMGYVPPFRLLHMKLPLGKGFSDFRRWPGGGVEQYMQRVIQEIMPLVVEKYNLATDPAR